MAESVTLHLDTAGDIITVTLPGTSCTVTYRRSINEQGLVALHMEGDLNSPISQAEFLERAWRIANDKARELGWLV
jgi:hypothetical protein